MQGFRTVWTSSKNISCTEINLRTKTLRLFVHIRAKTYCYLYLRISALTTSSARSSRCLFYSSRLPTPLGPVPPTDAEWHSRRDKLLPVVTTSIWQTRGRRRRRVEASSMYACSVLLVASWTTSLTGNHHFRLPYLPPLLSLRLHHCCCCCMKPCNDAVLWLMTCATSHLRRPTVIHGNRNLGKMRALRCPPLRMSPLLCAVCRDNNQLLNEDVFRRHSV